MNDASNSASPSGARSSRLTMAIVLGSLTAFGPLSIDMYLPALPTLAGIFTPAHRWPSSA
ncbi:hypothetical protein LJK88_34995 [Paenibacillus sp. P26]|nr:hypothetical protein LJK88_34995 [Paenibacillus sp. P26]